MSDTTKVPSAGTNVRITPATSPGSVCGTTAAQKARAGVAPRSSAASTSRQSTFSTLAYTGSTKNGR